MSFVLVNVTLYIEICFIVESFLRLDFETAVGEFLISHFCLAFVILVFGEM